MAHLKSSNYTHIYTDLHTMCLFLLNSSSCSLLIWSIVRRDFSATLTFGSVLPFGLIRTLTLFLLPFLPPLSSRSCLMPPVAFHWLASLEGPLRGLTPGFWACRIGGKVDRLGTSSMIPPAMCFCFYDYNIPYRICK